MHVCTPFEATLRQMSRTIERLNVHKPRVIALVPRSGTYKETKLCNVMIKTTLKLTLKFI